MSTSSAVRLLDGATPNAIAQSTTRDACFHCGEPASRNFPTIFFGGSEQHFCCIGCHAVAEAVIGAGLGDFYRQRTSYSTRATALDAATAALLPTTGTKAPTVTTETEAVQDVALYLNNLTCTACAWLASHTLNQVEGVRTCDVNFSTATAYLKIDRNVTDANQLTAALARVGLVAEPVDAVDQALTRARHQRRELIEFGVASLSMMQVMMLAVPLYLTAPEDLAPDTRALLYWGQWIMTLPALFISAKPILRQAWRATFALSGNTRENTPRLGWVQALRTLPLTMDVPIALALVLTFAMSTVTLFTNSGHLYFDAITMFIFLLLGARLVESRVRRNAIERIQRMANPRIETATRLDGYPRNAIRTAVASNTLRTGDVIEIAAGESISADGEIISGRSEVDEALMTGESRPVAKVVGDSVLAGTINQASPLIVRVTAAGRTTTLSQLARRVEVTLSARTALAGIAETTARLITPLTLLLALAGGLIWLWIDATRALEIVVSVLAVTCPCALALAVPAARTATLAALAKQGLLVTNPNALDALRAATDVVFDKTGTITTGQFSVVEVRLTATQHTIDDVLRIAAALETGSRHPIAKAICAHAEVNGIDLTSGQIAHDIEYVVGGGVTGMVEGRRYRLGTIAFAESLNATGVHDDSRDGMYTIVSLAEIVDAGAQVSMPIARITLQDSIRPHVSEALQSLIRQGKRVHLASGDSQACARAVAASVGIDPANVRARQLPTQKQAYIESLKSSGAIVVPIGDGVNDALMLAAANAGIGLGTGSALTKLSADIVIDENKQALFTTLQNAFAQANRSHRIILQNLGWAALYNVIALPLAFAGLVTPLIAAVGMAVSSLIVVLNAARLSRPVSGRGA